MGQYYKSCNFHNFIVGPSNRNAYAFCREAFDNPGGRLNPLFIYGETGTGKTHLLKAILTRAATVDSKAVFIKGRIACRDGFLHSVLRKNELTERFLRFILIDDLDELVSSTASVEELLYLLDTNAHREPQIVVSSTIPPGDLAKRGNQSLLRRLREGVVVKISAV
jgi:chromosomal replication initiator protein